METEGEERVRAKESLKQLEDAAFILDKDARSDECKQLSNDVPQKLSAILHNMTSISSRDDAERLLAAGMLATTPPRPILLRCLPRKKH